MCSDPVTSFLQLTNATFWHFTQLLADQAQAAAAAAFSTKLGYTVYPQQVWIQAATLSSFGNTTSASWLLVMQLFGNFTYSEVVSMNYVASQNRTFLGSTFGYSTLLSE